MVECYSFNMWNMSLSQLFGKSPKINFICGECQMYNEGRIPIRAIELGKPFLKCSYCNTINHIPICINYEKEDYDE